MSAPARTSGWRGRAQPVRRAGRPAGHEPRSARSAASRCTTTSSGRRHLRDSLREVADRLGQVDPELQLARGERLGLRFVVPGDDEWPAQVDDLTRGADPLDAIGGAPVGLWVRGPCASTSSPRPVAVVGSRSATTYGAEVAAEIAVGRWPRRLGRRLRRRVRHRRGRAPGRPRRRGCDRRGAGVRCRPGLPPGARGASLEHLAGTGRVVSESPPGRAPAQAALPVPQPADRRADAGGRWWWRQPVAAARSAPRPGPARLHRPLMGVPGPVTSAPSEGVHRLLRSGQATLVTGARRSSRSSGDVGRAPARGAARAGRAHDRLDHRQQRVLEAVPVAGPAPTDSISRTAGVGLVDVAGGPDRAGGARAWSRRRARDGGWRGGRTRAARA